MDFEVLFSDSKWRILTELSQISLSPKELAEKTGTTISNISTQVKLLEAMGFVQKEKVSNIKKGKPRKNYSLKKEFGYLILASKSVIGKKMFNLTDESMFYFTAWMINDSGATQVLIKMFCEHEENLIETESIGYLGIRGDELEILILTGNPTKFHYLNDSRVKKNGKEYRIKTHIHKTQDFINGVNEKNEYFTTIVKRVFVLTDKNYVLSDLKKGRINERENSNN